MNTLLEKLGSNPQRSLRIFLRGLAVFIVGTIFIALGYYSHHLWQLVGIGFIAIGSCIASWGYLGIFSNRLMKIFNKQKITTKF